MLARTKSGNANLAGPVDHKLKPTLNISQSELDARLQLIKEIQGQCTDSAVLKKRIASLDTNEDGKVDKAEFMTSINKFCSTMATETMVEGLQRLARDKAAGEITDEKYIRERNKIIKCVADNPL